MFENWDLGSTKLISPKFEKKNLNSNLADSAPYICIRGRSLCTDRQYSADHIFANNAFHGLLDHSFRAEFQDLYNI